MNFFVTNHPGRSPLRGAYCLSWPKANELVPQKEIFPGEQLHFFNIGLYYEF